MKRQKMVRLDYFILFMAALLAFAPLFAYADGFRYEEEAQILNALGLYRGISEQEFNPDLGSALDRETGIVMLIRLFGLENDVAQIENADEILSKFRDAAEISAWAKKAVAYAVNSGLVIGFPDGTFGARMPLNGKAYCSLILRQLGYTPDYNQAPAELTNAGGISKEEAQLYTDKALLKDDLVGISYGCLKINDAEGKSLLGSLIEKGVIERAKVEAILAKAPDLSFALAALPASPAAPAAPTVPPAHGSDSEHSVDRIKPIVSITQGQDNVITVRFSEPVISTTNGNGAKNLSNYRLLSANGDFVENAASISESTLNKKFDIRFDSLVKGSYGEFTLSITGINDYSGNTMNDYEQKISIIPFSIKTIE